MSYLPKPASAALPAAVTFHSDLGIVPKPARQSEHVGAVFAKAWGAFGLKYDLVSSGTALLQLQRTLANGVSRLRTADMFHCWCCISNCF